MKCTRAKTDIHFYIEKGKRDNIFMIFVQKQLLGY